MPAAAPLDPDEIRVLAECERESLIYRSLPLGLLTFFATQHAMSRNFISPKAKWVKLSAALFSGYIIGKLSYASTCRTKVLTQIPDSNLAHTIRGVEKVAQTVDVSQIDHQPKDPSEAIVSIPNTPTASLGVNQYGDTVYKTDK
jgi:hypothetical protein